MQLVYRKDIQIVRGIAVLLVVFFHCNIGGFDSGFLGVDVFFVISGYLMALMYDPFNKSAFFLKRAKKLLPAYFAVVLLTLLVAVFAVTPNDYRQASNQAWFATFFASNIGFWLENSYFDKAAFKPLLHLWSIGVEIQFYLLVPIISWVSNKNKTLFTLMIVASASLCFIVAGVSPKASFFWLPFRLWEFLIGFGVAKYLSKGWRNEKEALPWLGAASLAIIVCIPFVNVDGTSRDFMHGHPGAAALLICLATATVLSFNLPKIIKDNPFSNLLEKIGQYSYSIYLVHFPLIDLALYRPFSGSVLKPASLGETVLIAMLVASVSMMLFKVVEQPFRASKQPLRWIAVSAAFVLSFSQLGALAEAILIPKREMLIYEAWFDRDVYRCGKLMRFAHPGAITCEITKPIVSPSRRVLLVGNSFADAIKPAFAAAAQARDVQVYFVVQNDPLMQNGMSPENLIEEARARHAEAIVLHYSPGALDSGALGRLAALAETHNLRLSFIMPPPVYSQSVPLMLWKDMKGMEEITFQTIDGYLSFNSDLISELAKIESDKFKVYEVATVLCKPVCRLTAENGKPLYFDAGHSTLTGADMLEGVFGRVVDDLFENSDRRLSALTAP